MGFYSADCCWWVWMHSVCRRTIHFVRYWWATTVSTESMNSNDFSDHSVVSMSSIDCVWCPIWASTADRDLYSFRWPWQMVHPICWLPSALCTFRNFVHHSTSTCTSCLCPSFRLGHVRSHQMCRIYPKSISSSDWCEFSMVHRLIPCAMPYSLYRRTDSSAAFSVQQHPQRMSLNHNYGMKFKKIKSN